MLPTACLRSFVAASGRLARAVGHSVAAALPPGDSVVCTAIREHLVVSSLLVELDRALPPDLRIGLVLERDDRPDSSSFMAADGFWENKAASMGEAVEDLRKKTAFWTPLYYGGTEYLPCFAAAGSKLQFYAILRASGMVTVPVPISPQYDLTDMAARARAVVATIKFYQLLRAQYAFYPAFVLPAGALVRAEGDGFTRELLFRTDTLAVRKRVSPWRTFASLCGMEVEQLQELYDATAQRQGLVHAVEGGPILEGNMYSVDIVPVGLPSSNTEPFETEDEARQLLHGLLHGLAAIHQAGFVHRDLRWDNFACSPGAPNSRRWFLLDLESCAPADQQPAPDFAPVGWRPGTTLVGGRYTRASDLFQLGMAVLPHCALVVQSPEGRAFLEAISTPPANQTLRAEDLLGHEWLRCEGDACSGPRARSQTSDKKVQPFSRGGMRGRQG
ncbi:hypothetical protein HYH03_008263 [Edaphochlamys debaryana]|uniref:Protein kinase domain-containing protein n=1 Tax=Edaphochlamys debaryana TaxID=47281 RepID=A0A835Y6N6_9CHLO|nr:hypothetical protein HYH03_008263 [Edaphochlamys debaryana]|eukprot:KAG2493445.1 hypothetical protein HYH03_008263 [Edaphochlamys debaryana]